MAAEQEAKKMVTIRLGVSSCGSTSMPSASHHLPIPCTGEPTAAGEASSAARAKVSPSRTAAFDATDPKTEPDVEGSAGRNAKTVHEMSTTGGRRGRYGIRPTSSYGAASLTIHQSASPSPCIRRGDEYREPHGGEGASSSVAHLLASSPACSKVSSSRAAACDATDPKPEPDVEGSARRNTEMLHKFSATGGRQGRYRNHKPHSSEVAIVSSSFAPSVDKEQRWLPAKTDSAKSSAILENIRLQKIRQPSQLQRGGAGSDWGDPQVSGRKNEVSDHGYWQTNTVSSRISSALDSKLELVDAFEGGNHSSQFKKPLAMLPREPIRIHLPRRPSVLDRRGALDAISESRLHQTHIGPKLVSMWEGKTYIANLGSGGVYGYPHPPPFYRCEVCDEGTAFYRLKCCHKVVCESCGCACDSAEAEKDKRLQYQREKLPKVKLEGSDLFLWQPCSYPHRQMLCMAKRTENHLHYYFAPIQQLMNPKIDPVEVCVYDFCQQGHDVISLSKTEKFLARNLLR